ncbi:MAG: hypothetical protein ABI237_06650 [Ginsengibacter sp.]
MNKVALIIIYNHQYNSNIEIVEKIYNNRFTHIHHLVPFYKGDKSNVIPVYESSYYFQGYIVQGLKSFYKEEYSHYFFIADDMILNPAINENNYREHLQLSDHSCFISRLSAIDEAQRFWSMNLHAIMYNSKSPGVEAETQLPTYSEAQDALKKFNVINKPLSFEHIWQKPQTRGEWLNKIKKDKKFIARYFKNKVTGKGYDLSYPLVRSYSDIFIISSDAIKQFCHYAGVFAATRLFVELAIPTALVFSAKEIKTEKDIQLKGMALWTKEDISLLDEYDFNLKKLLDNFPKDKLYIHPVKLSKWVTEI